MRINSVNAGLNNQTKSNGSTSKVSSTLMSTTKDCFSPSFGICFVDRAGRNLSPGFIDRMTPNEIANFAQRVFSYASSPYMLKEAFGYKEPSLIGKLFDMSPPPGNAKALERYNKLKPYTDRLHDAWYSLFYNEIDKIDTPTEEMCNRINTLFDQIISRPISKDASKYSVKDELKRIQHEGARGFDINYNSKYDPSEDSGKSFCPTDYFIG